MFEFVNYGAERLEFLLLIILRTSGLFLIAPILGYRTLPSAIKVGMVLIFSLILNATLADTSIPPITGLLVMALSLPIVARVLEKGMVFVDGELHQMFLAIGKV